MMVGEGEQVDVFFPADLPAFPPLFGAAGGAAFDGHDPGVPLPAAADAQQAQIREIPGQGKIVEIPFLHSGVIPEEFKDRFGQDAGLDLAQFILFPQEFPDDHVAQFLGVAVEVFSRGLVVHTGGVTAVPVVAIAVVQLLAEIPAALVQTIIESVAQVGVGAEMVDTFLDLEQMGIDKEPHAAVTPVNHALVVGTVLRHEGIYSVHVFLGFPGIRRFPQQIPGGSQAGHVDPVMVLVEVGRPAAAVGAAAVLVDNAGVMTDLGQDTLPFFGGKGRA